MGAGAKTNIVECVYTLIINRIYIKKKNPTKDSHLVIMTAVYFLKDSH